MLEFTRHLVACALSSVGFRGYHSEQKLVTAQTMRIRILPALSDNYMYLLVDEKTQEAAIVDPVDPDSVIQAVEEEGVKLEVKSSVYLRLLQFNSVDENAGLWDSES